MRARPHENRADQTSVQVRRQRCSLLERAMKGAQAAVHDRVDKTSCFFGGRSFIPCDACNGRAELGACLIRDDFHELRALQMAADAVIYFQGKRFRASNPFAGAPLHGSTGKRRAALQAREVTRTDRRKTRDRFCQREACPSGGDGGNRLGRR
jgi:hypothetical protein